MSLFYKILIIYSFTVVWSIITFKLSIYLANKVLRQHRLIDKNKEKSLFIKLEYSFNYITTSLIPIYNIWTSLKFLFESQSMAQDYIDLLKLYQKTRSDEVDFEDEEECP